MTIAVHPSVDTTWAQWYSRYATRLHGAPDSPDLVARYELGESPEHLPGLPGTWWVVDHRVFVAAKPGDRLDHDGIRIAGIEILDPVDGAPGVLLRHDDHAVEVLRQDDRITLRVHAPVHG